MRLHSAIGSMLCALGALASSGCNDERIPIYEIEVVDRTTERERERSPAPYVLAPLETPAEPGRLIYEPPTYLGSRDTAGTRGDTARPARR